MIDAFYFNRRSGILVFRSPTLKKNLLWYEIGKEKIEDYIRGIREVQGKGWKITGTTTDGKPGVIPAIEKEGIPAQMCHFHQTQIVTRYITQRPRLEASIELKEIMLRLKMTDKESFEYWIQEWREKWSDFLNEKTFNPITKRKHFTHTRLRKAYRSVLRHMPNLFTFLRNQDIPNTTNSLDGTFSHLRDKLRIHRGLRHRRKIKLIEELLNYPHQNVH